MRGTITLININAILLRRSNYKAIRDVENPRVFGEAEYSGMYAM